MKKPTLSQKRKNNYQFHFFNIYLYTVKKFFFLFFKKMSGNVEIEQTQKHLPTHFYIKNFLLFFTNSKKYIYIIYNKEICEQKLHKYVLYKDERTPNIDFRA